MSEEGDLELVKEAINDEGFDYAMVDYSDWKEVKDETFQLLLRLFLEAREELKSYIFQD